MLAALEAGTRDDVAAVAAVREVSIVIAVALSAAFLGEEVTRRRLLGAAVVVAGVALIGARRRANLRLARYANHPVGR